MKFHSLSSGKALRFCGLLIVAAAIVHDVSTAVRGVDCQCLPLSAFPGPPVDAHPVVSVVRSDDETLSQPVDLASHLTREQIDEMVRAAVESIGGIEAFVRPGDWVTIKPNVVGVSASGNGENTDNRVVAAVARLVDSVAPGNVRITVCEASARRSPDLYRVKSPEGNLYYSGTPQHFYETAGYFSMVEQLQGEGINVELVDGNYDYGDTTDNPEAGLIYVPVPVHFTRDPGFWRHPALVNCDVLIEVPVMKIHSGSIYTGVLKNNIGSLAGAKHGFNKSVGGPDPGDPPGIHRDYDLDSALDEEIVGVCATIHRINLSIVDAINGKERGKSAGNPRVRRNMIVAGNDPVATDAVAGRLMGLNPDDLDFLFLAHLEGLGVGDLDRIEVRSDRPIEESIYRFEKPNGGEALFGMTNRIWLLKMTQNADINVDGLESEGGESAARPIAGVDGWSEPQVFSGNFIDFEAYFDRQDEKLFYAFSYFTAPESTEAELWIDADEAVKVFINGTVAYEGTARYHRPGRPSRRTQIIRVEQGVNTLLVKLVDHAASSCFIMNICESVPVPLPPGSATYTDTSRRENYSRYDGNRILGLRYTTAYPTSVENWTWR